MDKTSKKTQVVIKLGSENSRSNSTISPKKFEPRLKDKVFHFEKAFVDSFNEVMGKSEVAKKKNENLKSNKNKLKENSVEETILLVEISTLNVNKIPNMSFTFVLESKNGKVLHKNTESISENDTKNLVLGKSINIKVKLNPKIIKEHTESEFTFSAILNEKYISNKIQITRKISTINFRKMHKDYTEFAVKLQEKIREKVKEKNAPKELNKDLEFKYDQSLIDNQKNSEFQMFSVTLKRGKYKVKRKNEKRIFEFPFEFKPGKTFKNLIKFWVNIRFEFTDKYKMKFHRENFFIKNDDFFNKLYMFKSVFVDEKDLLFVDFPVTITVKNMNMHLQTIVLKRMELPSMDLLEWKRQRGIGCVLKEMKSLNFELQKKEKKVLQFNCNLNDLPFEMIYEIVRFIPINFIAKDITLISKYFNTITNYYIERMSKVFLLKDSGISKTIIRFMFEKSNQNWMKTYITFVKISKLSLQTNMIFTLSNSYWSKNMHLKKNAKEAYNAWVSKDEYDDAGPSVYISRRKCF